ncbi:HNH endonuclease [Actinidia rufa]|uniref:HNH endonuclease n=1 Tax=Actinidia rufa TaxID=165716 RepID=A0A7J0E2G7_9ERIC|nr:HNH endonuclease [Actinidia rufa]
MAQFTVQGRLKPLFNGDGKSMAFEPKDHRRRRKLVGDSAPVPRRFRDRKLGLFASSTRKSDLFNAEASLTVGNDGVYDDSDDEFERDELSCFRGLVLDISYRPVNVVCWKRAICLEFMEKADVLEYYDQTVNSPSGSFYIPAVLRREALAETPPTLFYFEGSFILRIPGAIAQYTILVYYVEDITLHHWYCSSPENLTIDHVLPIARGGKWTWENLVTCMFQMQFKKGSENFRGSKDEAT